VRTDGVSFLQVIAVPSHSPAPHETGSANANVILAYGMRIWAVNVFLPDIYISVKVSTLMLVLLRACLYHDMYIDSYSTIVITIVLQ
jgi:hypothetical protein